MYTIAYVITDNGKLRLYQELMKSLTSLRLHMPDRPVVVLCDEETQRLLKDKEIHRLAQVRAVEVPEGLRQDERSRSIKTRLRELLCGDFLYIDSDTVVCRALPETVSQAHVAAAWDMNQPTGHTRKTVDEIIRRTGIALDVDGFYNGGVLWARDTQEAHSFFQAWAELWMRTRESGLVFDQPALDNVVAHQPEAFGLLDGRFNCQMTSYRTQGGTPMQILADAYIIHYFHAKNNPYALGNEAYADLPYDDPVIVSFLRQPYTAFVRSRLVAIDEAGEPLSAAGRIESTRQYRLLAWLMKKHPRLFGLNERILHAAASLVKGKKKE